MRETRARIVSYCVSCLAHVAALGGMTLVFDEVMVSITTRQGQATIALQASMESIAEPTPDASFVAKVELNSRLDAAPRIVEPAETPLEKQILDVTDERSRTVAPKLETKVVTREIQLRRRESERLDPPKLDLTKPLERPTDKRPVDPVEIAMVDATASAASQAVDGADVDEPPRPYDTNASPPYPPAAYAARIEGRVVLRIRITAEGLVESVKVETSSGRADFDQSALDTARLWRFTPPKTRGIARPLETTLGVNFAFRSR
jgi:protein TonB